MPRKEKFMSQQQPFYSEAYTNVINLATRYAAETGDKTLLLKHLLAAFLDTDEETFRKILGVNHLIRPENLSFQAGDTTGEVRLSSQVNRILSLHGGRMDEIGDCLGPLIELGLPHLAAAMLINPRGPVLELLQLNAIMPKYSDYDDSVISRAQEIADADFQKACAHARIDRINALRQIKTDLTKTCYGQEEPIETIIAHIATAIITPPSERGFRPISFAFIGGMGTGKSLAAKKFQEAWAHSFGCKSANVLDMSRFSVESLVTEICGRDLCWKDGGKEGLLTQLAARDPRGVIIIENIDKAHPRALVPIANMLTTGKLTDEYTAKEVSFARNIVILTTNQGTSYIESGKFAQLCSRNGGMIPREKLVEGLTAALKTAMSEKADILAEILHKVDVPVLFKRHSVRSMYAIIGDAVDHTISKLKSIFEAEVNVDRTKLINFFIETLHNLDSAHGIFQTVENTIIARLEKEMLDSADLISNGNSNITIEIGELPDIDTPPLSGTNDALSRLENRTLTRIKQAKQLEYDINVSITDNMATIRIVNLRHKVMPSIEEADWFSVCPPNFRYEDLVGMESARIRVEKFLSHSRNTKPEGFKPDHILLYGPPGTGKTAFAKAIAHSLNKSFICVNAAKFTTSLNDNRAVEWIQNLFATAERTESIIFIDECDAIGSREQSGSSQAPVINTLLTLLDGLEESKVLVIGATNRPDMLDPALTRPGRLHTRIKVDVFRKAEDRAKLIDIFCRKANRTLPEPLKRLIVHVTDKWAPANILSVLREMFEIAGDAAPTRRMFAQARNTEFAGDETQRPNLTDDEKRHVAIHEAGHALVAILLNHDLFQVTIKGNSGNLGFVEQLNDGNIGMSLEKLNNNIDIALAGNAAERILGTVFEGSGSDFAAATKYAQRIIYGGFQENGDLAVPPRMNDEKLEWERIRREVNKILAERRSAVNSLLTKHKATLKSVAEELVRNETLFKEDIVAILQRKTIQLEKDNGGRNDE